jgi:hypothetical protein
MNVLHAKPVDSSWRMANTGRYLAVVIVCHHDLALVQGALPDRRGVATQQEETNVQMDMEVEAIEGVSFESGMSETSCP